MRPAADSRRAQLPQTRQQRWRRRPWRLLLLLRAPRACGQGTACDGGSEMCKAMCCLHVVINNVTEAPKATMRQQLLINLSLKRENSRLLNRGARRRALVSRRPARSSYLHTGTVGSTICKEMAGRECEQVGGCRLLWLLLPCLSTENLRAPTDSNTFSSWRRMN
jgi:hypothetical protein